MGGLVDWVVGWAQTPSAVTALFFIAFAESSFFPIPPDILLITMALIDPQMAFKFALVCAAGSVLGGMFGYLIGWQFMAGIGDRIIAFYGLSEKYQYIQNLYMKYDAWAIAIAGFNAMVKR